MLVLSSSVAQFPCLHDWSHCGSSLCFVRLIVIAMSHAHVEWLSSTSPLLHFLHFLLPYTFYFLDVVDQPRALPLRSWVTWTKRAPPQVMSPTTTSLRRLMSSSPRSPWPSNGSLKTSTTMTSPSVRRSSMRAEDEPITLKKKACRPVWRRRQ